MYGNSWLRFVSVLVVAVSLIPLALGRGGPTKDDPSAAGTLYGDLVVIERDGNGEPILRDVSYVDPETGDPVVVQCEQPLGDSCALLPLWGEYPEFDPELNEACGVHDDYLEQLHELSFGRGSVARAPATVIDRAYAEFIKTINASQSVEFDPAGRFKLLAPKEDDPDTFAWKTIDAPLENLGLYREEMLRGCLGTVIEEVTGEYGVTEEVVRALSPNALGLLCPEGFVAGRCAGMGPVTDLVCEYPDYGAAEWWMTPSEPDPQGVTRQDMLYASGFIAAATDKKDPLHLDEIVVLNTYLGINSYTYEKRKKERILIVDYFDFRAGGMWFSYNRAEVFPESRTETLLADVCATPDPHPGPHSFVSGSLALFAPGNPDGVDLDEVSLPICRNGEVLGNGLGPMVCDDPGRTPYDPGSGQYGCGGANWFAQAAEHARKTVWYLHNWEVPEIEY